MKFQGNWPIIVLLGLGVAVFVLSFTVTYWKDRGQERVAPEESGQPSQAVADESERPKPGYQKVRYSSDVSLCDDVVYRDLEAALATVETACTLTLVDVPTVAGTVGQLVNLRELVVRADDVEVLPSSVDNLTELEILDVAGSENLRLIATDISGLQKLRFLNIAGTSISELPKGVISLTSLERLFVHEGQFADAELERIRVALPDTQVRVLDPELVFLQ